MGLLREHEVFAAAAGERINAERLAQLCVPDGAGSGAYEDCTRYVLAVSETEKAGLAERFRITPALRNGWQNRKIVFALRLYIKAGCMVGGRIFKHRETYGGTGYEMTPTQQELRIARRILDYIREAGE